jgi:hypothetical protein
MQSNVRGLVLLVVVMAVVVCVPKHVSAQVTTNDDVESSVRSYFADAPTMAAIAKCESGFRQFDGDGSVLFDPSYSMVGVFQISTAHLPESLSEGMDIMTLQGNMAYARYLYDQDGTDPWLDSMSCWLPASGSATTTINSTTSTTSTNPVTPAPTNSLSLGIVSSAVVALQQMLNHKGFAVASAGPGSPGQETNIFGSLTRAAVQRFQCAMNIVCSGDEPTTGFGMVTAATYAALTASSDKAAEIAQVKSQMASLQSQLDALSKRLNDLQK